MPKYTIRPTPRPCATTRQEPGSTWFRGTRTDTSPRTEQVNLIYIIAIALSMRGPTKSDLTCTDEVKLWRRGLVPETEERAK